jgi:intein-encoded DNA endonuclease-like protein
MHIKKAIKEDKIIQFSPFIAISPFSIRWCKNVKNKQKEIKKYLDNIRW